MSYTQKCIICSNPFEIKPCHKNLIICCSPECRKKKRAQNARRRQKTDPRFAPPTTGSAKAKKISILLKKAYRDGRMKHMKSVWKAQEKKWTGKNNPRYRHGNSNGYKMIKIDGKWIPEHRHLMEQKIGRKLKSPEVVHHINGNKHDNRIKNLIVMTIAAHVSHHQKGIPEK